MAVVFIALGSRGDVQPMAVLAGALAHRGISAKVIALADYSELISRLGGEPVPIAATLETVTSRTATGWGRAAMRLRAGQGLLLHRWTNQIADEVVEAIDTTVAAGDTVISTILTRGAGLILGKDRQTQLATVIYTAQLPTIHRESHYMADLFGRSAAYNRWGTRLNWTIASNIGRPITERLARRLGLRHTLGPTRTTRLADRQPIILAASPWLVPPAVDWPRTAHQTGFLATPPTPGLPPIELIDFLANGPTPVHVGFGSMTGTARPHGHAGDLELLVDAARIARRRIITIGAPGQRTRLVDDRVLVTSPVQHSWLLPRTAGVIHHAGAGTSHEALRAGVPSMGIPFGVDQPYHAQRLHTLGVGPAPLPIRQLTPRRLATALRELTSGRYDQRAAELGRLLQAEDGVAETVALLGDLGLLSID